MNTLLLQVAGSFIPSRRSLLLACCFLCGSLVVNKFASAQIDGFIEPYRQVDLSSDETGAILSLLVKEGDHVNSTDVIAKLDDRLQSIQVEIAKQMVESTAQFDVAERTLKKRTTIFDRLRKLQEQGHAGESEIIRAEMELSIAQAKLNSVREDQIIRNIELRRAEIELDRRNIRAPFSGIISKVLRREGEFLSPLHPEVVKLIKVDKVYASFAVPSSQLSAFPPGQEFEIEIAGQQTVTGIVDSVGVQTDAQSGTVQVKFVIKNTDFSIRSGELCSLKI